MDPHRHAAQQRWDQHRVKQRLHLRLSEHTRTLLVHAARQRQMPINELAEHLITRGLASAALQDVEETALPHLSEALRVALAEQARRSEDRLARLLTRAIISSDTTRRLLFAHMVRQWGNSEQLRQAHDSARLASINALRERGWAAALGLDTEEPGE
jgi:hypothetical protein